MRVYIPATLARLREWARRQRVEPLGGTAFAVTSALRSDYPGADVEELEYLAMSDAARASLRLIGAGDDAPLRVVLAADVDPAGDATDAADGPAGGPVAVTENPADRAAVTLSGPLRWSDVAAVHLDAADAGGAVRAAAAVILRADLGDADAEFQVGAAEDFDLAWYLPDEIAYLLEELDPDGA